MADLGVNFKDLKAAVEWSQRQLVVPRRNRLDAIKQYVGSHYSTGGTEMRVPTNFIELAVTIYMQQLAARAPRAVVTTKVPKLKPYAYSMEIAINQIPDEIGLDDTLRKAVVEALFCFAIVKVGIAQSGTVSLGHDVGEPFADLIDFDDYFVDMSAKNRSSIQFEGNDYWLPIDIARAMYDGKESDVEPDDYTVIGEQGESKTESISVNEGADLYKKKVWMRDVWIPDYNKVCTYGVKSQKVFRVIDWDGPEGGPYKTLGFSDVPGNLLPLPPVSLWRDLHELGNTLFRKLGRQADAKKTVAAFQGGHDDDVERLKAANDGDGITYSGGMPQQISVGGIDNATLAFYIQLKDVFSYLAGNLDSLGGLSPMTETVGQDRLLTESANARMSFMKSRTAAFIKSIFEDLAWYEWTDPVRERVIEKRIGKTDMTVTSIWSEETREGDWLDYNFDIDVYSMTPDTPEVKLQKIGLVMQQYVLPMAPMLQEQGAIIDFRELMSLISKLSNVPELNDIVKFQEPQKSPPEQNKSQPVRMPANTTRTYERVNRPGATRQGKDDAMSRLLLGSKVQQSEGAAIGRPVG